MVDVQSRQAESKAIRGRAGLWMSDKAVNGRYNRHIRAHGHQTVRHV